MVPEFFFQLLRSEELSLITLQTVFCSRRGFQNRYRVGKTIFKKYCSGPQYESIEPKFSSVGVTSDD